MLTLTIRTLQEQDIPRIVASFVGKPTEQYERYFAEQVAGQRVTLVGYSEEIFVGYLNVVWEPHYPPFRQAGIPEIQDFNVVEAYRCQGIGSRLMDAAETLAGERSEIVGIGVGMYPDYGPAQRLYVKRGYIPDGRGLYYDNRQIAPGETVRVDDSLTLQFTKRLR